MSDTAFLPIGFENCPMLLQSSQIAFRLLKFLTQFQNPPFLGRKGCEKICRIGRKHRLCSEAGGTSCGFWRGGGIGGGRGWGVWGGGGWGEEGREGLRKTLLLPVRNFACW